jgi:non-specific serine/threonine protein kinase
VAGICCKLDGLPLAIELAAARIRHLPTQTIYEKLEKGLQVLTGGARDLPQRQRTLRNSIAWSYNLLDDGERVQLARLAVFRGGCSLLAVEAVCEGLSIDVLDGLASLVDKSLVQKKETPQGEARFVMLELILEYAHEQLEASGEAEAIRRQHARYFVALAERAEVELRLPYQKYWFHLLEMEIDNLRAALEWSLGGGDITLGIRIASGTFLYWYLCGRQDEGIRWTQHLLMQINEAEPAHQIRLLRSAARLNMYRDRGTALRLSRQALAIARDYGDKTQLAWALCTMDTVLVGNPKEKAVSQEALALFRELDDLQGIARVVNNIGEHARVIGDDERAKRAYQESLILAERMGDTALQYTLLVNNAFIAQHEGNHWEAIRLLRRSLALSQDIGVPADVARILLTLAGSLGALGRPRRAAHLLGAAYAYLERRGALIDPNDLPELDRNMAFVRAQLGEAAFEQAWAEGQALTLEQAVAHATSDSDALLIPRCGPDKVSQPPGGLTRRELEVALMVAEGKSNREIAEAFVIAERTVEGHVSNILSKLGFRSRTQVSIWVIENKLSGR